MEIFFNYFRLVTIMLQFAFPHMMIQDIKGLRTFRVLRALKTISIVPGKFHKCCTVQRIGYFITESTHTAEILASLF